MKERMKSKSPYIVIGVLLIVGVLGLFIGRKWFIQRENLLLAYERELIPGIVCFGDSLTFGSGGDGVSYPSVLEENLERDRIYIPVSNLGIGGENTVTIAARAGAIPFRVSEFTIPEETNPVEITFLEEEGKEIRPIYQGDAGINPCTIAGVTGRISGEKDDQNRMTYYFTRSEAGESTHVLEGTEVVTFASSAYADCIYVVFMGENGGWNEDVQELIAQQQAIFLCRKSIKADIL